jgi:hypothetical protein
MRHARELGRAALAALTLAATLGGCSSDSTGAPSGGASSGGASSGGASSDGASSGGASSGGAATDGGALPPPPSASGWQKAFAKDSVSIDCTLTEAALDAKKATVVTVGTSRVFVGYEQSGQNQNPVVARFDAGAKRYCEHHESEAPDGRAYGVTWDGGKTAYVVYTIVGGGSAFDAKSKGKWLEAYGNGGASSKVSVIGAVDADLGSLSYSTFVVAKKQDGSTNSLTPTDAVTVRPDANLELRGSSAFQPMNPDKSLMQCTAYPFDVRYVFAPSLATLVCSSSTNCTSSTPCP